MALPAAAQAQLDALRTADTTVAQPPAAAPAAPIPAAGDPPAPSRDDATGSVTITRDEFNDLQAAAGRVKAAEGRMESLTMDVEALTARLTAAEARSKGNGNGEGTGHEAPAPTSTADDWQPTQVQFTDQENTDYADSRSFVEKVALEVLNRELPKLLKGIKGKIDQVNETVTSATRRVEQAEGRGFNDEVRSVLKTDNIDFDTVVNHQHWRAFAESEDEQTGFMYADVLRGGIQSQNIKVVARVFKDFAKKYGLTRPATTGYEGGVPTGGSRVPENDDGPKMLPFSERKAAHKKFINGEMTQAEYQRICDDYSKAEREGRIDYDA